MIGHAVCPTCHPDLDGPALCGATVTDETADLICVVCLDLDHLGCTVCRDRILGGV